MLAVEKQGFEIIPEFLDRESIASVSKSLDEMPLRRGRAGARNALWIKSVRDLAFDSKLINIASSLLGGNAVPFRATLFNKSFATNWLVVWHQDTALPMRERRDAKGWGPWSVKEGVICAHAPAYALELVLAMRVHLDHSNEENGSLRVLPQTHTLGVLSDDQTHELAKKIPPVDCHIAAGGLLLMRPLLVHSSSKATSETARRRILHIEYAACLAFPDGIELFTSEIAAEVRAWRVTVVQSLRK
jgi:ectoine hydroxylase-related dioxygenase (phytanoyl-CoA dioxygenase family)